MKKLLGAAALILAFSPFAQAQSNSAGFAGHPDARNDRRMEQTYDRDGVSYHRVGMRHHRMTRHMMVHHRHMRHHHHGMRRHPLAAPTK